MPTFKPSVIALNENNFNVTAPSGRKRVLITDQQQQFCPQHAEKLAEDVLIASVGYVDPKRKSRTFCEACKQKQTFANQEKKA